MNRVALHSVLLAFAVATAACAQDVVQDECIGNYELEGSLRLKENGQRPATVRVVIKKTSEGTYEATRIMTFTGERDRRLGSISWISTEVKVTKNYEEYLEQLMTLREAEGVQLDLKRFELIKGDASKTVPEYLERHPETIVSLAYFDFDIYQPTRDCLEAIRGNLTKGSVVAFDELNHRDFPGETLALKEVFGLDRYKLVHTPYSSARAYFVHD